MAIPESQLDTWSHQGSVTQSSDTYRVIKNALMAGDSPYSRMNYSVFLQGSYGNDTNIYAESDVDVVIGLDDCWHHDLEELTDADKEAYKRVFVDGKYTHADFKRDVLRTLTSAFGGDVKTGDKAISVAGRGNRRKADVIVALQYRRYHRFKSLDDQLYDKGICFFNLAGHLITNYPVQHSENLTKKHQSTSNWLKPMVRILKNLRGKLIEDGRIKPGIAPSYYLEGLLYNVPDEAFANNYQDCFVNAVTWIQTKADKTKLECANGQYYLLWDNSHTSWPRANCDAFLNAAVDLWDNW